MIKSLRPTVLFFALALGGSPALAVSKEMVQLQTQVQQLQDAVARLQQSNDERMGVLKDLVQQSADSVNRMSVGMGTLQKQVQTQQESATVKSDQVSSQVQALNDSLDELKARFNRLDKAMQEIQNQQQSISAALQNLPQSGAPSGTQTLPSPGAAINPAGQASTANSNPATQPPDLAPAQTGPASRRGKPASGSLATIQPAAPAAPPVEDLYKTALSDYMAAKFPLAAAEFRDVLKFYPDNGLSGNSTFYLGEIDYRAAKYTAATHEYDTVLEQFPGNSKIPAAHLHKGQALIALKQNDAGIRELRALIQRFPNSPEAALARTRLSSMGVPLAPRH